VRLVSRVCFLLAATRRDSTVGTFCISTPEGKEGFAFIRPRNFNLEPPLTRSHGPISAEPIQLLAFRPGISRGLLSHFGICFRLIRTGFLQDVYFSAHRERRPRICSAGFHGTVVKSIASENRFDCNCNRNQSGLLLLSSQVLPKRLRCEFYRIL